MRCYLANYPGLVNVSIRAESEDGETVGDSFVEVRPGEEFFGFAYEDLRVAAARGFIDIDEAEQVDYGVITSGSCPTPEEQEYFDTHVAGKPPR